MTPIEAAEIHMRDTAVLIVTFNPNLELIAAQMRRLPTSTLKVVVDNGSQNVVDVKTLLSAIPGVTFRALEENVGLAAGLNHAMELAAAIAPPPRFVLLMDQDSVPLPGSVETLAHTFNFLVERGERVGCVGPRLIDVATGLTHGFHQISGWRWTRMYPEPTDAPVRCHNLNGSGTFMPLELMQRMGGLDAKMFIDHVDTEWAFRVQHAGLSLWGVPAASFEHEMGLASRRYWFFGWRLWPIRTPNRHRFLFRNAVDLMSRDYVPRLWKIWAIAKLGLTFFVTLLLGPQRSAQVGAMLAGMQIGLRLGSHDV